MIKWFITCSVDGINCDYEEEITEEIAHDYWACDTIAEEHGCTLWGVDWRNI